MWLYLILAVTSMGCLLYTSFKGLTGDESYYFNDKGELVIAFAEYDVAPGYMGAVEFTIPASVTGTF